MSHINFKAIPTLRITTYDEAKRFYVDLLGFVIDWEHRFGDDAPVYMQVSKYGMHLHLSENARFRPGTVFIETNGLKNFEEELEAKKPGHFKIETTPWGTFQMEITDPFENLLRFNEPVTA